MARKKTEEQTVTQEVAETGESVRLAAGRRRAVVRRRA